MTPYEKIIFLMRQQGNGRQQNFLLGEMTAEKTCKIGDQEYQADDLLVSSLLREKMCRKVEVTADHVDKSTYTEPLKKGDTVLIAPISDTKFVILEKVVDM